MMNPLTKWKLQQALSLALLPVEYIKDFYRFIRYGKGSPLAPKERRLFFDIILTAHTVEKGLSLAQPRPFFGKANIQLLHEMVMDYPKNEADFSIQMSMHAIHEYLRFHTERKLTDPWIEKVAHFQELWNEKFLRDKVGAGFSLRDISTVFESIADRRFSYLEFIRSRFSSRSYLPEVIPLKEVELIVRAAQQAPSQCNRQSPNLHLYQDEAKIRELLAIQGGTSGFSNEVRNLFVVTSEITAWSASSSRNQDYIDGSLFAMNLLLALHARGLAACPLNIAFRNSKERRLRRCGGIPDSERLLMLISFGRPNPSVKFAAPSPRPPLSEVLFVHSA
ncbi:MAG: nitroreductase family protein [Phycisphaeraceae bacterium]|nr:nitroreductase family protein [Phycisphaeraceae bacterium]